MTQGEALDILKLGRNVYLTGSAGSGKTHLLNRYIGHLREHDVEVAVTASTGVAATHLGGMTIHSWSGLGIRDALSDTDLEEVREKQYLRRRFEDVRVLVIDEVSMLHHFRLDLIERVCRSMKRSDEPFGGLQVILCGDFFQLPPVARAGEPRPQFVYRSKAWRDGKFAVCYLHEQFRQNDEALSCVLQEIRGRDVSDESRECLRGRYRKQPETSVEPTRLYTHNIDVDTINAQELAKISGTSREYRMSGKGRPPLVETLKKSCLAPETLRLKERARVMFVKNNAEAGYVNGTLGIIVSFDRAGTPVVETAGGKRIAAEPMEWSVEEGDKTLAVITQVPLRLAWAITVHKSQGMSLDAVEVDLSKSFEPGMGYVALSRVRTLAGLSLLGMNEVAFEVDPDVCEFDRELQQASRMLEAELAQASSREREAQQQEFLASIAPRKKREKKIPTHLQTKALLDKRMPLREIAAVRSLTTETIVSHIEKLKDEGIPVSIGYLKNEAFTAARFAKISAAFKATAGNSGEYRLTPAKNTLGPNFSYSELRLARLFLDAEIR